MKLTKRNKTRKRLKIEDNRSIMLLIGVPMSLADPFKAAEEMEKSMKKQGIDCLCVPSVNDQFSYTPLNITNIKKEEMPELINFLKVTKNETKEEPATTDTAE